jgi:hypothetical protein
MGKNPAAPLQPRLPESAAVYDTTEKEFEVAYRKDFKRHRCIVLIDNITFNATTTTHTSKVIEIPAYAMALIAIKLAVTLAPTTISINVEFSCDGQNWYKYMRGPFGDWIYDDAGGAKTECLDIPILAKYMRTRAVAVGTSAINKFNLSVCAFLNG